MDRGREAGNLFLACFFIYSPDDPWMKIVLVQIYGYFFNENIYRVVEYFSTVVKVNLVS